MAFAELTDARRRVLAAVAELARDEEAAAAALKLGPRQRDEVAKNRVLEASPVLPAIDRYTGVLYDALGAASLPADARRWLGRNVVIQTALLGPVRALDRIPDYRLSHDSRVPGLRLREVWAGPSASVIAGHRGLVVDARSQGYVSLGPLPDRADAVTLEVVTEEGGRRRALNHFNKHAKGELTRALALTRPALRSVAELVAWGEESGIRLEADGRAVTLVTQGQGR